jgi:hypothetical protein
MKIAYPQNGIDIITRAALGIGIGAAIAAMVSETAFGGDRRIGEC